MSLSGVEDAVLDDLLSVHSKLILALAELVDHLVDVVGVLVAIIHEHDGHILK